MSLLFSLVISSSSGWCIAKIYEHAHHQIGVYERIMKLELYFPLYHFLVILLNAWGSLVPGPLGSLFLSFVRVPCEKPLSLPILYYSFQVWKSPNIIWLYTIARPKRLFITILPSINLEWRHKFFFVTCPGPLPVLAKRRLVHIGDLAFLTLP